MSKIFLVVVLSFTFINLGEAGMKSNAAGTKGEKIKDLKLKVQPSIQADQIRVAGRSKDELQTVIQFLKGMSLDLPLQFTNYR